MYQDALEKSGHSYKLTFKKVDLMKKKRKRQRRVLWFNPPFSAHVITPVGKRFFDILDSCFPKGHALSKLFNHTTVKLSFSTVKNMRAVVKAHNKKILTTNDQKKEPCNCQKSRICPMGRIDGGCQASEIVYEADVIETNAPKMTYYGQTMRPFKERWREHRHAMENVGSPHATALSRYIWKLKNAGRSFEVKFSIKCRAPTFKSGSKGCFLCLKEKVCISLHDPKTLLNAKSEIVHKCIHQTKFELGTWIKSRIKKTLRTQPP